MKIKSSNDWKNGRIKFQRLENLARALMRRADPAWRELSLALLDDDGMTRLNQEYFSKNQPTDVISFTYGAGVGEIFVNAERAARAKKPSHELALYIAHGCDHLAGADDNTAARRARMRKREESWLRDVAPLIKGLK